MKKNKMKIQSGGKLNEAVSIQLNGYTLMYLLSVYGFPSESQAAVSLTRLCERLASLQGHVSTFALGIEANTL